jgi:RimJ/RimL family protein N-acetyltransferase
LAPVITTPRLALRELIAADDGFILELLNEPSFLEQIGDKGVRTLEDARAYIETGPRASYARHGFGLYAVELKDGGDTIGICGLLKRDALEAPDVGFALLPRFWSKGYAFEAAAAVLERGRAVHGLGRVLAITSPGNTASIQLLERLGFRFQGLRRLTPDQPEVRLFACD